MGDASAERDLQFFASAVADLVGCQLVLVRIVLAEAAGRESGVHDRLAGIHARLDQIEASLRDIRRQGGARLSPVAVRRRAQP